MYFRLLCPTYSPDVEQPPTGLKRTLELAWQYPVERPQASRDMGVFELLMHKASTKRVAEKRYYRQDLKDHVALNQNRPHITLRITQGTQQHSRVLCREARTKARTHARKHTRTNKHAHKHARTHARAQKHGTALPSGDVVNQQG